ncbi:MAG TPA: hypothetical protein VL551_14040 [Actinospica sp.]|nr:hypothetical protein [Actinospica sp.]
MAERRDLALDLPIALGDVGLSLLLIPQQRGSIVLGSRPLSRALRTDLLLLHTVPLASLCLLGTLSPPLRLEIRGHDLRTDAARHRPTPCHEPLSPMQTAHQRSSIQ